MILTLIKVLALDCTLLNISAVNKKNKKQQTDQMIPHSVLKKVNLEKLNKNTWIHIIILIK